VIICRREVNKMLS